MPVLHPLVKRRTGSFGLWVLYSVLFFPDIAFSLTIYLAHSLVNSFLDIHLVVHFFTLLICNVVWSQSVFKKELLSICSLAFSAIMTRYIYKCMCIYLYVYIFICIYIYICIYKRCTTHRVPRQGFVRSYVSITKI